MNPRVLATILLSFPALTLANITDATNEPLGFYPPKSFQMTTGRCESCSSSPQARWYFTDEAIAVPPSTSTGTAAIPRQKGGHEAFPELIWMGSTRVVAGVRLSADGKQIDLGGAGLMPFSIVPKLATNLSYYSSATTAFFAARPLRLRGEVSVGANPTFVARTVWPEDYTLAQAPSAPLREGEELASLVKAERGGAQSNYASRVLWQRHEGLDWRGKSVVGLMLNGAQGDDDEAHGGHFAIVTGTFSEGSMHHWLVNNFYGVNSISEKGIVAAVTPMDKSLMDLNNGQSFYRPSYLLVAILNDDAVAREYQEKVNHVFRQLYRHDLEYDHSKENCAGISSDVFRQMGWRIPTLPNHDEVKAIPAYAYMAATKRSLLEGRKTYDYFTEEPTRLFPAATFDTMGNDLLALAQGKTKRVLTQFEQKMGSQLEALVFIRIPQVPSSRAFGLAPVASISEYMRQAPADRTLWKIVPAAPRPFPEALRDRPAAPAFVSPVPLPVLAVFLLLLGIVALTVRWIIQRRRRS